jgi:hypothetical protein
MRKERTFTATERLIIFALEGGEMDESGLIKTVGRNPQYTRETLRRLLNEGWLTYVYDSGRKIYELRNMDMTPQLRWRLDERGQLWGDHYPGKVRNGGPVTYWTRIESVQTLEDVIRTIRSEKRAWFTLGDERAIMQAAAEGGVV